MPEPDDIAAARARYIQDRIGTVIDALKGGERYDFSLDLDAVGRETITIERTAGRYPIFGFKIGRASRVPVARVVMQRNHSGHYTSIEGDVFDKGFVPEAAMDGCIAAMRRRFDVPG